jgi:hypothetical protein
MPVERTEFRAEVRDVFSGDDLILFIDLGIGDLYMRKRFRLHGVDTPNAIGAGPDTEAGRLRSFVYDTLKRKELKVTVISRAANSLVGIVEIESPNGNVILNDVLIDKGYRFNRDKGK